MSRRLILIPSLFLALPLLSVPSAQAQSADILDRLKEEAMGFARGCDYLGYMNTVNEISESWDFVSNLSNWRPTRELAIPVVDFFSNVLQAGTRQAAIGSMEEQSRGLVYQLEQVCQLVMEVDETNRIHRIYQAGNFNIGNALDMLFNDLEEGITITPGTLQESLGREYAEIYEGMLGDPTYAGDTIYSAIHESLYASMAASDEMLESLASIQEDIDRLQDELKLRAERYIDEDGNMTDQWICPEGYPGNGLPFRFGDFDLEIDDAGLPICGPASPGRSQQIMAHTEVLKLQLTAILQSAESRHLEVGAVRLMADNQIRRRDNYADKSPYPF